MKTAKIFQHGNSQAVRLPKEFRFEGTQVRVRRVPEGVLLEPLAFDPKEWFARIDALRSDDFMIERKDPPPQKRKKLF